jgi:glycerol-3-phosphate dehydrogenase
VDSLPPSSVRPPPRSIPVDDRAPTENTDVVVIGGGVNGAGTARDLALRGLRVILLERNDLAFGASGNSSGMIHGGARYLTQDPQVTAASCRDSGYIQKIAPFLLFRIPFLTPVSAGKKGRIMIELVDAFFKLYDRYQPAKRGELHTRLSPSDLRRIEPGLRGNFAGAVTFDEWGVDGTRLCVLNAIDAIEHGAKVFVRTSATKIAKRGGHDTYVVETIDRDTGSSMRIEAKRVINATGAWGPLTASFGGLASDRVRVRPGKGIHVAFDRRLSNYAILSESIDGRQIFLEPWQNMSVLGTTDDDYFGNLDEVTATSEEVRYLVEGIARVFPDIREARASYTWAGVRPTLYEHGPIEDKLSREHVIVDHTTDGAPGVYSMLGGKLASYRIFSEEMSTVIARDLAPSTRCRTHELVLPGAETPLREDELVDEAGVDLLVARRLIFRHGARAKEIAMLSGTRGQLVVCPCEAVTEGEIRHAVRNELARSVSGVSRRTRLGLGPCGGVRCSMRCAQIVADERGCNPVTALLDGQAFLREQTKRRIPVLNHAQAPQEAFSQTVVRSMVGERSVGEA